MAVSCKETAIQKITEMTTEQVSKVLIFMAGMEAEHITNSNDESAHQAYPTPTANATLEQLGQREQFPKQEQF